MMVLFVRPQSLLFLRPCDKTGGEGGEKLEVDFARKNVYFRRKGGKGLLTQMVGGQEMRRRKVNVLVCAWNK